MADEPTKQNKTQNQPDYSWPDPEKRSYIGTRISRVDGPVKVSGRAKYTYDVHRPDMLFGKVLRSPYAHAKVVSIDTSAAEKMPGVKAVQIVQDAGSEIHWAGDDVVAVAAVDEPTAADAIHAIKVEYEPLPHFNNDFEQPQNVAEDTSPITQSDLGNMFRNQTPEPQIIALVQRKGVNFDVTPQMVDNLHQQKVGEGLIKALQAAPKKEAQENKSPYRKAADQTKGDADAAFKEADVVSEGMYGCPVITHCCLESHGSIAEWPADDQLFVHISTQNVSGLSGEYARSLKVPASNVHVHQDHMGGGFGSKFAADRWGIAAAQLSKKAGGKPVRIMLERDAELQVAGARPSIFAHVKVAGKKDGTITAWQSES
jgi:xanthine dehydrogenase YagR molybdenum-binding subunit